MRSRSFVLVVCVLVLLGVFAGGVYAYDRSHDDRIADGVRVGGIDVGGMAAAEARARLQRDLLDPLRRPIVVRRGDRRWRLTARRARIAADLRATVDEALARSRSGWLLERVWRDVTGRELDVRLQPDVTYSDRAVRRLVRRVERSLERPARDASVDISAAGIATVAGRTGVEVRARALRRSIRAAITSPEADRTFTARTKATRPEVTTDELADRYATVVVVNRAAFRLTLYKRLKTDRSYPIAVGQAGLETPAGLYSIQNKAVNPAWHVPNSDWAGDLAGKVIAGDDPSNPIKARWLGIYDGVGIHGTADDASIGTQASHGCIRMHIPDVEDLYDRVPVGASVYIA